MEIYIMFTFEGQTFVVNTSNFPVLYTDVQISNENWTGLLGWRVDGCELVQINAIWCGGTRLYKLSELLGGFIRGVRKTCGKATISYVMSIRPHGTAWLALGWFSSNLIFEYR